MIGMGKVLRKYYFRKAMSCWLISVMLFAMPVQVAMAAPIGGTFVEGTGSVNQALNVTNISVNQTETIINWDGFDTSSVETVNFFSQPGSGSSVLNRISGPRTQFDGGLYAKGMNIYLVNQNGIVFGNGSSVNVGNLIASSLDLTNADFLDGSPYQFISGKVAGDVVNEGTINAENIALIGKNVTNSGLLVARDYAIMAAGDSVLLDTGGPVVVEVEIGSDWVADDYTVYQVTNDAAIDESGNGIYAEHVVLAAGDIWSSAYVRADADPCDVESVATIDVVAEGDVTISEDMVAEAYGDYDNDAIAKITITAGDDVLVDGDNGEVAVRAESVFGTSNTSEILICAGDQVTVRADGAWKNTLNDRYYAGKASIEAIAHSGDGNNQSNVADVKIGAGGGVEVFADGDKWLQLKKPTAQTEDFAKALITADASGGVENTASVLVCAEDDIQVTAGVAAIATIKTMAQPGYIGISDVFAIAETTVISHRGDVVVATSGGGTIIEGPEGGTIVILEDGTASIESGHRQNSNETATITQIYATDVEVTGQGASIRSGEDGSITIREDGFAFNAASDARIEETDDEATLIVDSSDSEFCPDCPPCDNCDEEDPDLVAPLARFEPPSIEGCPELTQAVAIELGLTPETIQVSIGNALALNPNIQPCEACANLVNAMAVLRDEDGSRMAAMVQTFNALAPADAPFTPATAASIAAAFENADEGSQYASAMEYIDAFVQYVAILDAELGSPVGDSFAFVMEKYGTGVADGENANMAAFVAMSMESSVQ